MGSLNTAGLVLGALLFVSLPQERPTYSVKVAEVQVAATVKDKNNIGIAFAIDPDSDSDHAAKVARLPSILTSLVCDWGTRGPY